jgi:hypothetical protein
MSKIRKVVFHPVLVKSVFCRMLAISLFPTSHYVLRQLQQQCNVSYISLFFFIFLLPLSLSLSLSFSFTLSISLSLARSLSLSFFCLSLYISLAFSISLSLSAGVREQSYKEVGLYTNVMFCFLYY